MSQPLASFQISTSFQNLLDTVFHSIPKIVVFLLVLVIGWLVAKFLARIVDMILRQVKFDRFVERGALGQALARSNTDATSLIAKIVYYAILLVTLQLAFGVWGPNPISTMLNAVVGWLPPSLRTWLAALAGQREPASRFTAGSRCRRVRHVAGVAT